MASAVNKVACVIKDTVPKRLLNLSRMNHVSYNACPCLPQKPLCSDDVLRVCVRSPEPSLGGMRALPVQEGLVFTGMESNFLKILFQCQQLNNILLKKSFFYGSSLEFAK